MSKLRLIVFTKHFQEMNIDRLIETLKSVDAEGADFCVRPGFPVEPENAPEKLPQTVKKFKDAGLSIPLVTTPGDFLDPEEPVAEKVLGACGQAGVKLIKLGYWHMEEEGYWGTVENIRRLLEGFVKLAEKHQVKVMIHNHSGGTMGLNSSSVMNLMKGFDPKYLGVFADAGHLSLVGEPLPMALDIVKEYLSAVAVKDLIRERVMVDGKREWKLSVVPLREGFVDWNTLARLLLEMQFAGPISMHSEYSEFDLETVVDQTRIDIRFFRSLMDESQREIGDKV